MKRKGAKILVVDDEPDMTENLELILNGGGHEIFVETDSTKAIGVVDREQPDLVITDMSMPELDGLGLLHQVKTSQPDIPVIVCTLYYFMPLTSIIVLNVDTIKGYRSSPGD